MKKIIALLCALIMLTACCIPAGAATVIPDEEIAKEHGYAIYYNIIDGWEVPVCYYDKTDNTVPNQIMVYTNVELDCTKYPTGEVTDFYGVDILKISTILTELDQEQLKNYYEKFPNYFMYVVTTTDFYTANEVKNIFAEYDFITGAQLSECYENATDYPMPEPVACDVNFDNTFDTMDYITVKRAYFGTYPEAQMYCNKGDLNNNLEIDAVDSALMKRAYFDLFTVEQ